MKIKFVERDCTNIKEFEGLKIWCKPEPTHIYVIGCDVAEGVGQDGSCAQVLDVMTGDHVASYWSITVEVDDYAAVLYKTGYYYSKAHLIIESNSAGAGVIAHLGGSVGGLAYPNLYRRKVYDEFLQKETKKIGFRTTGDRGGGGTKRPLIDNLKAGLRSGATTTRDKMTIQELGTFIQDEKSGRMAAKGSSRDDRVMAYALAYEQFRIIKQNLKYMDGEDELGMLNQQCDPQSGFPL